MRIDRQIDPASLAAYGVEAARLLCSGSIAELASQFGYALAYHRAPATAIREDLGRCLAELNASSLALCDDVPTVTYFEPNGGAKLLALVECLVVADNGRRVLVELVAAGDDNAKHISLEDISAV